MSYKIERGILVPKAQVHPNPWNPNHMKPRQQAAVEESINAYGQVLELLVRPHPDIPGEYQIIDGEHRFGVLPDKIYCNVIHGLPDGEAKKLTIVMNETRGAADKIELAQLLAQIQDEVEDLGNALPYDSSELEEIIKLADVDWDSFSENFTPDSLDPSAIGGDPTDDFIRITISVTRETMDMMDQAKSLVSDEMDLHKDKAVAWGEVIGKVMQDYLAAG